ncbi:MAG TPA: DUF5357 family protein [Leptolyngbyaceae cyanobacterium M65_K2018_010]|nr:DUF5357 family protein [Leptolyngbyaceae cyanobacterium M65_K2018_010]
MLAFLRQTLANLQTLLLPQNYFSWQTIIYLSLFSWLMSLLGRGLGATIWTVGLMTTLSWAFLALGVGWLLEHNRVNLLGIPIAPWVSGAILCIFLFGSWGGDWLQPAVVAWPLVSFMVVAVPSLVNWDLKWQTPLPTVRQNLVLLFLLSLLFSCWLQFYFRIQAWTQAYPSLVADSFEASHFVYRIPGQLVPLSEGVNHLTAAETFVREQIDGKPWPSVERWLLNSEGNRQAIQQEIQRTQPASPESQLWQFDLQPITQGEGYGLKLRAIWLGPSAHEQGYYLEKSCQILPVTQANSYETPTSAASAATRWARVSCDLATPRLPGRP